MSDGADRDGRVQPSLSRRETLGAFGLAAMTAGLRPAAARAATDSIGSLDAISLLYPHESAMRSTRELGGLWKFRLDPESVGEKQRWFDGVKTDRRIPVPCSWNDLFDDAKNYFGAAWYETEIWSDPPGSDGRLYLRFGSAVYHARIWLNGTLLGEHDGGYLPFAFDIGALVRPDQPNRLVVRVENELRFDRVPAIPDPDIKGLSQQDYPQTTYDFFPYAGINRPVLLCSVPAVHLHDLTVTTTLEGRNGRVSVALEVAGNWSGLVRLTLNGGEMPVTVMASIKNGRGRADIAVPHARAWSPDDPFLYRLTIALGGDQPIDQYHMKIGIRTITVKGSQLLLNGQPIFLRGFGKHEDFAIHGRGLDLPVLVRDFELLKWIGANSFRTSHYPYAEETLMLADEYGFLVIGETPAVSMVFRDPQAVIDVRYGLLEKSLEALIRRDRNHPSLILWSLANEPLVKPFRVNLPAVPGAVEAGTRFFERLFAHARQLDPTRPLAIVNVTGGPTEWAASGDVICTNSYHGWYDASGNLDVGMAKLESEIATLREKHPDKPIFITEFGADAVAGLHATPAEMWTEEYQAEMISRYIAVLAKYPYVIGTHPWTFADFKTSQSVGRVGGLNLKGVFTRDRRPKLAATRLREIWNKEPKNPVL